MDNKPDDVFDEVTAFVFFASLAYLAAACLALVAGMTALVVQIFGGVFFS